MGLRAAVLLQFATAAVITALPLATAPATDATMSSMGYASCKSPKGRAQAGRLVLAAPGRLHTENAMPALQTDCQTVPNYGLFITLDSP